MPALPFPDPPIAGEGLLLRPLREQDGLAVIAACGDPEIVRWTSVPPGYDATAWRRWREEAERQRQAGEGLHLLIVDDADRLLGSISLNAVDRARGHADIGYWVAREARGRGVAARASRLLHGWARERLGLDRVEILVHRDNAASQQVARAAGFRDSGRRRPCPRTRGAARPDHIVFIPA